MTDQPRSWRTWQRAQVPIFWAEHELDEEPWTAAYGFVVRDGALTLAEVRIFPTHDTDAERGFGPVERVARVNLGEWSNDPALVPRGGLPTRLMRLLRPGEAMGAAFNQIRVENAELRQALERAAAQPVIADVMAQRSSKPRRDPSLLARVAVIYEEAVTQRKRPNQLIHERLHGTDHQVSSRTVGGLVADARAEGYLTAAAGKGRSSGSATEKARAIFEQHERAAKPQ